MIGGLFADMLGVSDLYEKNVAAMESGARARVLDWNRAAALIARDQPTVVVAGLDEDWDATRGSIYRDGVPILDEADADTSQYGAFFSSNWATPSIELDGHRQECWLYRDETTWGPRTWWPRSALTWLEAEDGEK